MGDGGLRDDPHANAQNLEVLLGKILRIDVDHKDAGKNYAVPKDNPFADRGGNVRGEIWAYGLRNVWRFSFDRPTGTLWAADVGQDRHEEIDIIVRGGNYGWNIREGKHPLDPNAERSAVGEFIEPVLDYPRVEGKSVTGGLVYRGRRLPELVGAYLYADFISGNVWALRWDGKKVTANPKIARTSLLISAFGEDEAGEAYFTAFDGFVYRFRTPAEKCAPGARLPPDVDRNRTVRLGERPHAGGGPDSVHGERAALVRRRGEGPLPRPAGEGQGGLQGAGPVGVPRRHGPGQDVPAEHRPGKARGDAPARNAPLGPQPAGLGGVHVHVERGTGRGQPPGGLAVHEGVRREDGDGAGEARVVLPEPVGLHCLPHAARGVRHGLEHPATQPRARLRQGQGQPDPRSSSASASSASRCPSRPGDLEAFPDWQAKAAPVATLARAYLDANCAMCHSPGGRGHAGGASMDMRFHVPLREAFPGKANQLSPGDPARSVLLKRMTTRHADAQMPPLATNRVDEDAVNVIHQWIKQLPAR